MPTSVPSPVRLPASRRNLLLWSGLLVAILTLPIAAMGALEGLVAARCENSLVAQGVLSGKTVWRIERSDCAGAKAPFFDVLIGADGKTMASAVTGRGEPHPLKVSMAGEGRAEVTLSSPLRLATGEASSVQVRLRRSGSPAERIDLEKAMFEAKGGSAP